MGNNLIANPQFLMKLPEEKIVEKKRKGEIRYVPLLSLFAAGHRILHSRRVLYVNRG